MYILYVNVYIIHIHQGKVVLHLAQIYLFLVSPTFCLTIFKPRSWLSPGSSSPSNAWAQAAMDSPRMATPENAMDSNDGRPSLKLTMGHP